MPLSAGDKLGRYEIRALIGAGGMGQVYRAHDPRLKRDVAIKVSAERFSDRFEREARAVAALSHPNICTLFDVGPDYLVMELVEGAAPKGPLPASTVLSYARQIADALDAAHEHGIIHRDLKPANLKVSSEGTVKILDFGLAKTSAVTPENPEESPTFTMATEAGIVLGTAPYMSPEQARGKSVDKRADIWAFGVVLYELITGQRPFQGETVSDVLAAVLTKEPSFDAIPPPLRSIIEKCLRKDPRRRWRDIGDVRMALDETETSTPPAPRPPGRRNMAVALGTLLTVALIGGIGWWRAMSGTDRALRPLSRFDVDLGSDVSLGSESPVLSRDGSRIAYASNGRLYVRRLDQAAATELSGAVGGRHPFFSPDGQWVGFFTPGKLKKIGVDGGVPVELCDAGESLFGEGSWGKIGIVVDVAGGLIRVPADGGAPSRLTVKDPQREFRHAYPQILPNEKAVLFANRPLNGPLDASTIEVVTIADRRRKTIIPGAWFARYVPTGQLIFLKHDTLFAVLFDLDRLEPRGTPSVAATLGGASYAGAFSQLPFDFSSTPPQPGLGIYRSASGGTGKSTVEWIDPSGNVSPVLPKPDDYSQPRLSPDGQRLAVIIQSDLYVFEMGRGTMTRLTFSSEAAEMPIWSADGQSIFFRETSGGIGWVRANGAGMSQILTHSTNIQFPTSAAPDGKTLAYTELIRGGMDLFTIPIQSDGQGMHAGSPQVLLNSRFNERDTMFSPDGKWIVYFSDESGSYEAYVRSYPDRGAKWQISLHGGWYPIWSRRTKELFYHTSDGHLMVVGYAVKGGEFIAEKPRLWSGTPVTYGSANMHNYDLAPDGKRVIASIPVNAAEFSSNRVVFLLNFFDELRRRASGSR